MQIYQGGINLSRGKWPGAKINISPRNKSPYQGEGLGFGRAILTENIRSPRSRLASDLHLKSGPDPTAKIPRYPKVLVSWYQCKMIRVAPANTARQPPHTRLVILSVLRKNRWEIRTMKKPAVLLKGPTTITGPHISA